jgi:hypothetical protein
MSEVSRLFSVLLVRLQYLVHTIGRYAHFEWQRRQTVALPRLWPGRVAIRASDPQTVCGWSFTHRSGVPESVIKLSSFGHP